MVSGELESHLVSLHCPPGPAGQEYIKSYEIAIF